MLRHFMYATYTKILILLSTLVFFFFDYPRGFYLCVGKNGCHKVVNSKPDFLTSLRTSLLKR